MNGKQCASVLQLKYLPTSIIQMSTQIKVGVRKKTVKVTKGVAAEEPGIS